MRALINSIKKQIGREVTSTPPRLNPEGVVEWAERLRAEASQLRTGSRDLQEKYQKPIKRPTRKPVKQIEENSKTSKNQTDLSGKNKNQQKSKASVAAKSTPAKSSSAKKEKSARAGSRNQAEVRKSTSKGKTTD